MAPTLKDMATWTDVIGHAQLRSFVDDEGNFWLEQKRLQADQGGKTGAQRAQRRMGVRRSRGFIYRAHADRRRDLYTFGGDKEILEKRRLIGQLNGCAAQEPGECSPRRPFHEEAGCQCKARTEEGNWSGQISREACNEAKVGLVCGY
jgi:hypothetical protein